MFYPGSRADTLSVSPLTVHYRCTIHILLLHDRATIQDARPTIFLYEITARHQESCPRASTYLHGGTPAERNLDVSMDRSCYNGKGTPNLVSRHARNAKSHPVFSIPLLRFERIP